MELWEILVTAAAGLSAGQIGAWLQARRDQRVELQRQTAETERLRFQLTEAREQHERDRSQTDTHDWRERRLAAYQAASAAFHSMLSNATAVTRLSFRSAVDAAADRCHAAWRDLKEALDLCAIIGTNQTRSAALSFADVAETLDEAVRAFNNQVHSISAEPEDVEAFRSLENVHDLMLGLTVEHVNEDIEHLLTISGVVEGVLDEAHSHSETWHKAARAELGVPD